MKSASVALETHIAGEVTSVARIILMLTRWRRVQVSSITQADPPVVTTVEDHALTTGSYVALSAVEGMTEINDDAHTGWKVSVITVTGDKTFTMDDISASGYSAHTAGTGNIHLCFGWTDHDTDLTYEGMIFRADASYTPSSSKAGNTMSASAVDLEGIMDESYFALPNISEGHIVGGLYDYAEIRFVKLNWKSLTDGHIWMLRGFCGQFEILNGRYRTEVHSLWNALNRNLLSYYTKSCRWIGIEDPRCGVNVATFTHSGSVAAVTDNQTFEVGGSGLIKADTYFEWGYVRWVTGDNAGLEVQVAKHASDVITLWKEMPFDIQVGDELTAVAGCDKLLDTCKTKFSNNKRHGGFPYVPGEDKLIQNVNPKGSEVSS